MLDAPCARDPAPHTHIEDEIVSLIPALRAFARTFCRNRSDADDLVQETLLKGISNIDSFRPGTRLKAWLFTIMRNTFYTRIKLARREAPGSENCASLGVSCAAVQVWSVRGKELQAAIYALPQHQREVILLIGVLGIGYEEAAGICGCVIGTVKSRLNRARAGLLRRLGETAVDAIRTD